MDFAALYEVLVDNVDIQIWPGDTDYTGDDSIIFEGKLYDCRKAVAPYMYNDIFQIEIDDHGKLYVGIEVN